MNTLTDFRKIASTEGLDLYAHGDYKPDLVAESILLNFPSGEKNPAQACQSIAFGWRNLVRKMPGAWSVVLVDKKSNMAYIITDFLGRDQVYYTDPVLHMEFKSRVSKCSPNLGPDKPNELYFGSVQKFGYHTGEETWKQGVYRALPQKVTILDTKMGVMTFSLMDLPSSQDDGSLRARVEAAFWRNLPKDLKSLTVLLSGGLDSSIMACLAWHAKKVGDLDGVDLRFITTSNGDDVAYAAQLANEKGFKLDVLKLAEADDPMLVAALQAADSPIDLGSLVPNFQLIGRAPTRCILTGDGPDELFGGYTRTHEYDSQQSDVFQELTYYHLPKLNQTAEVLGKSLICPYLDYSVVSYALSLPKEERTDKKALKEAFQDLVPGYILDRPKLPLKSKPVLEDKLAHRKHCIDLFRKTRKI